MDNAILTFSHFRISENSILHCVHCSVPLTLDFGTGSSSFKSLGSWVRYASSYFSSFLFFAAFFLLHCFSLLNPWRRDQQVNCFDYMLYALYAPSVLRKKNLILIIDIDMLSMHAFVLLNVCIF